MAYTLAVRQADMACRFVSSEEIASQLDISVPLQRAHVNAIADLETNGCRYSNQDFDVLAAAHRAIGRTEVAEHERAWVAANQHLT